MLGSELVKAASLAEEDLTFRKEDCIMFAKRRSVLAVDSANMWETEAGGVKTFCLNG